MRIVVILVWRGHTQKDHTVPTSLRLPQALGMGLLVGQRGVSRLPLFAHTLSP